MTAAEKLLAQDLPRSIPSRIRWDVLLMKTRASAPRLITAPFVLAFLGFSAFIAFTGIVFAVTAPIGGIPLILVGAAIPTLYVAHVRGDLAILREGKKAEGTVVGGQLQRVFYLKIDYPRDGQIWQTKVSVGMRRYHRLKGGGEAVTVLYSPGSTRILVPEFLG